jgi:23S rRNA (guanosine2251-2'-O)-methyltransferase
LNWLNGKKTEVNPEVQERQSRRRKTAHFSPSDTETVQIEGRNPVREALRAGRALDCILMIYSDRPGPLQEIKSMAHERGVRVDIVDRAHLDRQSVTGRHQGVIAIAAARGYVDVEDILQRAHKRNETPFLLLCDEIQDPHNLGALLRSAEATGVHGVVIPSRRAVGLTPTVAKTSAGAVEHVAVARVTNMVQTMSLLKEAGLWIVGAEMNAEQTLWEADLTGPLAVVVGSEGAGLGRLVSEHCDFMVSIPMCGRVNSLNASVAGSLILFEVLRQRQRRE